MGSIANRVSGELLHHVRTRWTGINSVERQYRRQPFRAARPADGQPPARGEAVCETCGVTVQYRIMSAGGTERRRQIWLVVSLAALILGLGSFVLIFRQIEGYEMWPVFGFAYGLGLFGAALIVRAAEDGVRVRRRRRRGMRRHLVRSGAMNSEGYERL